jgi:hypothetical protein
VGAVVPGPLPRRVIKVRLGGVAEKVSDLFLGSVFYLGAFPWAAERSSLATSLSAAAPGYSELGPCPTTTENNSEMRGKGRELLEST